MRPLIRWRWFWIFWLGGLAVFAVLAAALPPLVTDVAPNGLLDHQAAGTGERATAIQDSWRAKGVGDFALWSMVGDLVFIALYTIGGVIGMRLIWRDAMSPTLKKFVLVLGVTFVTFGLFDTAETVAQIVQVARGEGSDLAARLAAFCGPVKIATFVASFVGMVVALVWFRRARSA